MSNKNIGRQTQFNNNLVINSKLLQRKYKFPSVGTHHNLKTQPSQSTNADYQKHQKTKSVNSDQQSSYRQLSKILYKHLQKKIEYNQNVYQRAHRDTYANGQDSSNSLDVNVFPTIRGRSQHDKKRNHTENIRTEQINRPMKRLKYILRTQQKNNNHKDNHNKCRTASIDAYFDLSCLSAVRKKINHSKFCRADYFKQ